ncbi:lipocalin-like domain-containing protein [Methylobacterium planeticum]|uniref:lipocalin-like domain-containing protein n=1 Tax=Methylobacterium planeticum TaxID=2615211 RepID=UPI00177DE60D|nr:lipocalin-like domain-containing protein [Methylobacterium planeticum]
MIAVATSNDRPNVGDATRLRDADRVRLFRAMWAYAGTSSLSGNSVMHEIDTSWNEFWTGNSVTRDIEVRDGKLVFTTMPRMSVQEGKSEVLTLVWEKMT